MGPLCPPADGFTIVPSVRGIQQTEHSFALPHVIQSRDSFPLRGTYSLLSPGPNLAVIIPLIRWVSSLSSWTYSDAHTALLSLSAHACLEDFSLADSAPHCSSLRVQMHPSALFTNFLHVLQIVPFIHKSHYLNFKNPLVISFCKVLCKVKSRLSHSFKNHLLNTH